MFKKYIKPHSLTWLASAAPLFSGIFLATAELHGLHGWVGVINEITGHASPAVLINAGLVGIGLRGAID